MSFKAGTLGRSFHRRVRATSLYFHFSKRLLLYVRDRMSDAGVHGLPLSVQPVCFRGVTLLQLKDALIMRLCRLSLSPSLSLSPTLPLSVFLSLSLSGTWPAYHCCAE